MAPFAHPLFTTIIGIGVYFALQRRNVVAKVGCILLGYIGAVIMHGLWNGSSLLGFEAYFLVYLVWMVPIFGLAIWLGRRQPPQGAAGRRRQAARDGGGRRGDPQRGDLAGLDPHPQARDQQAARSAESRRQGGQELRRPGRRTGLRRGTESTADSATSGCTRCKPRRRTGSTGREQPRRSAGDGRLPRALARDSQERRLPKQRKRFQQHEGNVNRQGHRVGHPLIARGNKHIIGNDDDQQRRQVGGQ